MPIVELEDRGHARVERWGDDLRPPLGVRTGAREVLMQRVYHALPPGHLFVELYRLRRELELDADKVCREKVSLERGHTPDVGPGEMPDCLFGKRKHKGEAMTIVQQPVICMERISWLCPTIELLELFEESHSLPDALAQSTARESRYSPALGQVPPTDLIVTLR